MATEVLYDSLLGFHPVVFDLFIIKCDVLVDLPICFYLHMLLLWNYLSCQLVDNMLLMIILFVQRSVGELKLNQ